MTREELTIKFMDSTANNFILQLPTSFGKSKLALQKVHQWYPKDCKILIVIPFNILKTTWREEVVKWKYDYLLPNITFTTYVSLHKQCNINWDVIIFDEAHHLSERCRDILEGIKLKHSIALSATLKKDHIFFLTTKYKSEIIQVGVREAIEDSVLPDPKIFLVPLTLNNSVVNQVILKNVKKSTKNSTSVKTIGYSEKWKYRSYKGPLRILCTQKQYYDDISGLIEWYKQKSISSRIMKNMWLHKAGERLKWLAAQKEDLVKSLLKILKDYRVITFCQSIEQSETLGCACINSKVGLNNLDKFNSKKVKHIAAVAMLDEGFSPVDCKVGIFQMINSSPRIITQRGGRILRHKEPILIFPYFVNTREQEIIDEILKSYNKELVYNISISDLECKIKTLLLYDLHNKVSV